MTSSSFTPKTQCQQKGQLKIGASLAMRQALQVLQMPIGELKTWLNQVITQNPFLEWQEEPPLDLSEDKKIHYSHSLINIPDKPSLFSYLMTQARLIFTDKHLLKIAEWIIGNLEPTGFFPLSSIESSFSFDIKEIFLCLEKIKEFDPPGIGAKDVQESFLLQLKALKKENSLTFMIISDDFDALLSKKFSFLQKKYLINEQNMQKVLLKDIAILDPFPGYRFLPSSPLSLPVDIIFIPEEGSTPIEVISPPLPSKVPFSLEHLTLEEKAFCKTYQTQATQVIEAIQKRSHTLQKIAKYLVKKQKDYLERNSETLIPLSIQMIAKELGFHESTVTRALADKNLSCPRGVIPLKSLLSKGLSEEVSCDKAKKLLKKLIAEENKQTPLSDRALLEKMQQLGVPCARRTLTKYRQDLKIPAKQGRKSPF